MGSAVDLAEMRSRSRGGFGGSDEEEEEAIVCVWWFMVALDWGLEVLLCFLFLLQGLGTWDRNPGVDLLHINLTSARTWTCGSPPLYSKQCFASEWIH